VGQKQCEHHVDRMQSAAQGILDGAEANLGGLFWWEFGRKKQWNAVAWTCKQFLKQAKEVKEAAIKADQDLIWKWEGGSHSRR